MLKLVEVTAVPLIIILFAPVELMFNVGEFTVFPVEKSISTILPGFNVYPEIVATFAAVPAAVDVEPSQDFA